LKYKSLFINVLKISFVIILLTWLVWSGKLDFRQLGILIQRPDILVANIFIWLFCFLFLGAFRWYLLLRGQGLYLNFAQVVRLQLIGFFFNTAIPGAVGGDIIKAVYVIRGLQSDRKTPAMLTILLDRIIGLTALFFLGSVAIVLNLDFFMSRAILYPLVFFVLGGSVAIALVLTFVLFVPDRFDFFSKISKLNYPGIMTFAGIYDAIKVYKNKPMVILQTVLIGMVIQISSVTYACFLTEAMTGVFPQFLKFMAIFTVGVMTTALPLAPGGLGVGHVAFDKLFHLIDLSGGANVFNVMVLVQLILNLTGFIPYLYFKVQNLAPVENMPLNSGSSQLS
jgi:uncharacterized protein (TIRG00374 family)